MGGKGPAGSSAAQGPEQALRRGPTLAQGQGPGRGSDPRARARARAWVAGLTAILGNPPCLGLSASGTLGTGSTPTTPLHTGNSHLQLHTKRLGTFQKTAVNWLSSLPETVSPLPFTNTHERTRSSKSHREQAAERTDASRPCRMVALVSHGGHETAYFSPHLSWPPARLARTWFWRLWEGGTCLPGSKEGVRESVWPVRGQDPCSQAQPARVTPWERLSRCRGQTEGQPPGPPDVPPPHHPWVRNRVLCFLPPPCLYPTSLSLLLWPLPWLLSASNLLDPNWIPECVHLLISG